MEARIMIIGALLTSACMTLMLALYCLRRLRTPGAKAFLGLMASTTLYSAGYALELSGNTLESVRFALHIEYLGLPFISVFWVILAMRYTGYCLKTRRRTLVLLYVIPLLVVFFNFTNNSHHLFYAALELNLDGPFPIALITRGPLYHIHLYYAYACFLAGNFLFFMLMIRSVGPFRKQAAIMFGASLVPWFGDLLYQARLSPYGIDMAPFGFTVVGPLLAVALFRFKMLDLAPIARDMVFDVMHEPVLVLDPRNRLADFNKSAQDIFPGLRIEDLGHDISFVLDAYGDLGEILSRDIADPREISIDLGTQTRVYDLSSIPIECDGGNRTGRLLMFHDITGQKQLLNRLRELAVTDGLTGVFNHRHFMEMCREEIKRAARYKHSLSLILMDLDDFKKVNDRHGHLAGDAILRSAAKMFLKEIRSCDMVGRYGGEEFAVILPETSPDVAMVIAERLRVAMEEHFVEYDGNRVAVTASFGVHGQELMEREVELEEFLKKADKALYLAKAAGRNTVKKVA